MDEFLLDQKKIRRQARKPFAPASQIQAEIAIPSEVLGVSPDQKKIQQRRQYFGPIINGSKADRKKVIAVLNEALASILVCALRYKHHYYLALGAQSESVTKDFLEYAKVQQLHLDQLAGRIIQLEGKPDFNPKGLAKRSHSQYFECKSVEELIRKNLVAGHHTVEAYSEIIHWLGNDDPATRKLMEIILEKEEGHASDLAHLLTTLDPEKEPKVKKEQI